MISGHSVIWFLISFLFILQVVVFSLLALRKKRIIQKRAHENALYKQTLPKLAAYLTKEDQPTFEVPDLQTNRAVVERLLSDFIATTKDEVVEARIQEVATTYLTSYYKEALASNSWPDRMNTLFYIQTFKMRSFMPLVKERFAALPQWDDEKKRTAKVLASFGDSSILDAAIENPTQKFYQDLLTRFPAASEPTLFEVYTKSENPYFIAAFISYIGVTGNFTRINILEKELANPDSSIRIQALKAIGDLFHMTNSDLLKPFFSSPIWQERMVVVQLVKKLNLSIYTLELKRLLGDPQWWVRYYAAESILESDGAEILSDYAHNHPDEFARDMAEQWLSTGEKVTSNE